MYYYTLIDSHWQKRINSVLYVKLVPIFIRQMQCEILCPCGGDTCLLFWLPMITSFEWTHTYNKAHPCCHATLYSDVYNCTICRHALCITHKVNVTGIICEEHAWYMIKNCMQKHIDCTRVSLWLHIPCINSNLPLVIRQTNPIG